MPRYLVNVQETYVVEADDEDAVYEVPREQWEWHDGDVLVVGEAWSGTGLVPDCGDPGPDCVEHDGKCD